MSIDKERGFDLDRLLDPVARNALLGGGREAREQRGVRHHVRLI